MKTLRLLLWVATLSPLALATAEEEKVETKKVGIGPAKYEIPTTWAPQRPRSSFRKIQYGIPLAEGDEGKAEFYVSYFDGGGGAVDENIKRWIGMFQDRKEKEKVDKLEVGDLKITTLEVAGTYKDQPAPAIPQVTLRENYRMLAAIVETPQDGLYFFRATGPSKSIEAQRDNWLRMLKSASKE